MEDEPDLPDGGGRPHEADRRTSSRAVPLAVAGAEDPEALTPAEVQAVCRAFLRSIGLDGIE